MHSRAGKISCARAAWTAGEPLEAMADETARSSSIIFWRGRARSPCAFRGPARMAASARRGAWREVWTRVARVVNNASSASSSAARHCDCFEDYPPARVYLAIRAFSGVIMCGAARRRPGGGAKSIFRRLRSEPIEVFRRVSTTLFRRAPGPTNTAHLPLCGRAGDGARQAAHVEPPARRRPSTILEPPLGAHSRTWMTSTPGTS